MHANSRHACAKSSTALTNPKRQRGFFVVSWCRRGQHPPSEMNTHHNDTTARRKKRVEDHHAERDHYGRGTL